MREKTPQERKCAYEYMPSDKMQGRKNLTP